MSELLAVFGRLHPVVLHLPIGLIVGLAALELLGLLRREPPPQRVIATLMGLTQLAAAVAVLTGLTLVREGGYPEELSLLHRNLGLAFLLVCIFAGRALRRENRRGAFRVLLVVALGLGCVAGHYGGSITHGGDFLLEPLTDKAPRPTPSAPTTIHSTDPTPVTDAPVAQPPLANYVDDIAPILEAKCVGCHGEQKRKGRLALHSREAIENGGGDGPVLIAGDSAGSPMVARMLLSPDDDDHMPPGDKPQPSARERALIAAWIDAGASFEAGFAFDANAVPEEAPTPPQIEPHATTAAEDELARAPTTPSESPSNAIASRDTTEIDSAALAALKARLVHVQPIAQDDPLLWIDFAAPATKIDERAAIELLEPLVEHVGDLSLARTKAGDETLRTVQKMRSLQRLDLRSTPVTDAGFEALRCAPELREVNISQTALGDAAVDVLATLPKLERVFVWRTSISTTKLAELHRQRPTIDVDAGDAPDAAPLETESEVKFTSDAPPPGARPAVDQAVSLTPINATCPVSGSPVDAKYSVVFEGKVIGFCCPNCPKEFWADPAAFKDKLGLK